MPIHTPPAESGTPAPRRLQARIFRKVICVPAAVPTAFDARSRPPLPAEAGRTVAPAPIEPAE